MAKKEKKPATGSERVQKYRERNQIDQLSINLARRLNLALEQATQKLVPKATKKAIIEAAIEEWLKAHGFLTDEE